jgi:preprotein translocase subunit YajC
MSPDIVLFALLAVMIVFMFMNNKKRKKQASELQEAIAVGTWVMLTSGIYGEITAIDGDRVVIESAPGSSLTVNKLAVRQIEQKPQIATKKSTAKTATAKKPATKSSAK